MKKLFPILILLLLSGCARAADVPAVRLESGALRERAAAMAAELTHEELAGQVFLGRCPLENAAEEAAAWQLGGYVLFAENVADKTPETLRQELETIQAASPLPLLLAVDEEGGSVNRLSRFAAFRSSPFPSPMALYAQGGWEAIGADTAEKCELLRSLGLNVNLAPVADVCSEGSYMYPRSFGGDAALTAEYTARTVRSYAEGGVGCVLKHFPGYGDNADTHTGPARDSRSLSELQSRDLRPFAAGIDAGAGCILVSHSVVAALDGSLPASLSPAVYGYLREGLDFCGVAMTDDLAMDAIRLHSGREDAAVRALRAGCDLVCTSDYRRSIPAVLSALERGTLSEQRLREAAARVIAWKLQLGLVA